jgi:hypothetical protein
MYHIEVFQINIGEEVIVLLDGLGQSNQTVAMVDDGEEHTVHVSSVALILN